jgi:hypothetical protein
MTVNLILPAIVCFSLMVVGLALTVFEFNRIGRKKKQKTDDRMGSTRE